MRTPEDVRPIVLIATHAAYSNDGSFSIQGPAHSAARVLSTDHLVWLLEHPLFLGDNSSKLSKLYRGEATIRSSRLRGSREITRRPHEFITSFRIATRVAPSKIIAVDPVSALPMILYRFVHPTSKLIYYSADYSAKRFSHRIANTLYHWLDKLAARRADEVWAVSRRILRDRGVRRKQGQIWRHVPNSPRANEIAAAPSPRTEKFRIAIVSNFNLYFDFPTTIEALKLVASQGKEFCLVIVGDGFNELDWKFADDFPNVDVALLGSLRREDLFGVLNTCDIGLAIYSDLAEFRFHSDPGKVRDYLACGLAVVMTTDFESGEEIQSFGAGLRSGPTVAELSNTVLSVINDAEQLQVMKYRAIEFSEQNSFEERMISEIAHDL